MDKLIPWIGSWLVAALIIALASQALSQNAAGQYGTQRAGNAIPVGSTPISNSVVGTTAAVTATLAADTPGYRNTYVCGFQVRSLATAATIGNVTVTGTVGGTLNFEEFVQALATGIVPVDVTFTPCLPSSGVQTAIAVVAPAAGSGGVTSVSVWGYQY